MKHYHPNFDEFMALAERGNTIPVYRQLLADALTPVTAYERLSAPVDGEAPSHALLLESVVGGERIARYSFAAADPRLTLTIRRGAVTVQRRGEAPETSTTDDPLAEMGKLLADYRPVPLPGLPTERAIAIWGLLCLIVLVPVGLGILRAVW